MLAFEPEAIIGSYANPLDLFLMNSCINSASISYSHTPGFTNDNIRRIPFSVISQAICIC